jgi:dihydroneopterin aldolase
MARLSVVGLEFFAFHGCHPLEQKTGGRFRVDIHIDGDFSEAEKTDKIESAIDYVMLMNLAEKQMSIRCNLIETVAKNIADGIADRFSSFYRIEAIVYKLKAPLKHQNSYVSVNHVIENNGEK